jgi:hypothetical protein
MQGGTLKTSPPSRYVGGGVGYAHRTQGTPPALSAHPHFAQWQQLHGLVQVRNFHF